MAQSGSRMNTTKVIPEDREDVDGSINLNYVNYNGDLAGGAGKGRVSEESSSAAALQNNPTSTHELALASVPPQHVVRKDKASKVLGVAHNQSMEPVPAASRTSVNTFRSATLPTRNSQQPHTPTSTLASLYVVSGLPKSPHTWNLADADSTSAVSHSEGAVGRFWRAEVLGHTVTAGVGGRRKRRGGGGSEFKGAGALSKSEVGKMLSKTLKLSFTREVEIVASTLQPTSTVHSFTFTTPDQSSITASPFVRHSLIAGAPPDQRLQAISQYPYLQSDPYGQSNTSRSYLGPSGSRAVAQTSSSTGPTTTWYGVCLTVWSHADAERSTAIRRALEATSSTNRLRKESGHTITGTKLRALRAERKKRGKNLNMNEGNNTSAIADTTEAETDGDDVSESEFEVGSVGKGPGGSTLFLPGDTVFWLPYALTLVSRHPIYDLMRDFLTLSWARFSKDVAAHTLQISKILSAPAPRAGDLVRLDATASGSNMTADDAQGTLEVVSRFPGGLDFGRGLVDTNFVMWPLFKALSIDNILTVCEIAMAPTGRVLFLSRYPAMLSIAVLTVKYLAELRGWNGVAHPIAHCRDAKIYVDDPGPWIMGLGTEARYSVRPTTEMCVVDLDINYVNCPSPPPNCLSTKNQRERFKQRLMTAFDGYYHSDHSIPSEFKEAFPAGRFRPLTKIQAKRGVSNASAAVISESIKPPEWWNGAKVIQIIDGILQDKMKPPSLLKRITSGAKPVAKLTSAEQAIQSQIRRRASAFVDARDDLETKIGRLSRRLNFLVNESDLWREKFITFESYAEKLSTEASDLRSKINREQRESKRLSGMITATTTEKTRLQNKLRDTEAAHTSAMIELETMKLDMEKMEEEREQMVAEVEAQIERALQSMLVDSGDEDGGYASRSRPMTPGSPLPISPRLRHSRSAPNSRRHSVSAPMQHFPYRDSGFTDTTVVEPVPPVPVLSEKAAIPEEDDEDQQSTKARRSYEEPDGLDAGISEKSDRIAQKVLQIQQRLEKALQPELTKLVASGSDSDRTSSKRVARSRKKSMKIKTASPRPRSMSPMPESPVSTNETERPTTPTTPHLVHGLTPSTTTSTMPPVTPGAGGITTDDEDIYQSANDASPNDGRDSFEEARGMLALPVPGDIYPHPKSDRERSISNATAKKIKVHGNGTSRSQFAVAERAH